MEVFLDPFSTYSIGTSDNIAVQERLVRKLQITNNCLVMTFDAKLL